MVEIITEFQALEEEWQGLDPEEAHIRDKNYETEVIIWRLD